MTAVPDRYSAWDAAYVLGALSPAERREFEEHLAGCPACQAAVSELAGLPGLLAQVAPDDAALLAVAPEDVIGDGPPPGLVGKVMMKQRRRRRRLVLALSGAIVALAVIIGGIGVAVGLWPLGPSAPQRVAFVAVAPTGMTAVVDLTPVGDGTDIKTECVYAEDGEPTPGAAYADYSIFVVDRAGRDEQIKHWPAKPNKQMRPGGHTAWRMYRIDRVEIRDSNSNVTLLRASLR